MFCKANQISILSSTTSKGLPPKLLDGLFWPQLHEEDNSLVDFKGSGHLWLGQWRWRQETTQGEEDSNSCQVYKPKGACGLQRQFFP